MADQKLIKYADVLVNYSLELKKGDEILIQGENVSTELIKEVYKKALKIGAHPLIITTIPEQEELFYKFAGESQLNYSSPYLKIFDRKCGCNSEDLRP